MDEAEQRDEPERERSRGSDGDDRPRRRRSDSRLPRAAASLGGVPAPPHSRTRAETAAGEQECGERADDDRIPRRAQPEEDATDRRHAHPEPAGDLALGRLERVDEAVVVALEDEAIAVPPDDAMQDDTVEIAVVVADDVSDGVGASLVEHRQVTAVERRLHARAVDDRVV